MTKKCQKDREGFRPIRLGACSCAVLPGDTVYYITEMGNTGRDFLSHFEPATEEELIERGYLKPGAGMTNYEHWAKCFREEKVAEKSGEEDTLVAKRLNRKEFESELKERYDGMRICY